MPTLSPTTLTQAEQRLILPAAVGHLRDHLVYSLALATGLRLAEIVVLDIRDVFNGNGRSPDQDPHPRRDRQARQGCRGSPPH